MYRGYTPATRLVVLMIVSDLLSFAQPVDSLTPLEGNPRKGDVAAVAASLSRFGQRKPIVVRESDRVVVAGNHTLAAAVSLGWTEIAAIFVDDDKDTSLAYALADNRTTDLGTYDDVALLSLLQSVPLLEGTGYTDADILQLLDKSDDGARVDDVEDAPRALDAGELLKLVDVSVDEPEHETAAGDVWALSEHILVVAKLHDEWLKWVPYLRDDICFAPYPDPYYTTTDAARINKVLFVQPNLYLAGHLLDKHASAFGADTVKKLQ